MFSPEQISAINEERPYTCRPIDNGPHPYAIGQYTLKTKTGPVRYICVPNDTNIRTRKFGINQSLGGMSA